MIACLLCPAPAVADGLCVADGARLWWATTIAKTAPRGSLYAKVPVGDFVKAPVTPADEPRFQAAKAMPTADDCHAFLEHLDAARAEKARREGACCSRDHRKDLDPC